MKMAATAPNQKVVHVNRQKCDKNFLQISKENWYAVNKDLGPYGLQLYLYIAGNKDGFDLALSQEAAEQEAGIKKTTYHSYVKTLIAKGYLVPRKENSNIYDFYEIPKREEDKRAVPTSELKSLPHELSSLPDGKDSLQGGLTGSQPNKEIYNIDKIYNINQIIKDSTQDGNFVF
jgi:hypothetical protein